MVPLILRIITGARRSLGEGDGTPLQYSCLENPMDWGAWKAAVHGVAEGRTRLSDFTFTFHFHSLEKEMATHSSVLAWRIPGTGDPGGLLSLGSHRVGHDWSDLAAAATIYALFIYLSVFYCEKHAWHQIYPLHQFLSARWIRLPIGLMLYCRALELISLVWPKPYAYWWAAPHFRN